MSYRPKRWQNPYYANAAEVAKVVGKFTDVVFIETSKIHGATYEAGADAILEALKAEGLAIKVEDDNTIDDIAVMVWLDDKLDKTPEGTLVFVPKEQV